MLSDFEKSNMQQMEKSGNLLPQAVLHTTLHNIFLPLPSKFFK